MKKILILILSFIALFSSELSMDNMIVRISDIKIYPEYLNEYLTYAKEVAETSMEKEKGVIALYPMIVIKDNTQIKILEIYKNQVAYEEHIKTKHFQKYKQGTLHMVKSLELIDTYQLSEKNFKRIFKY